MFKCTRCANRHSPLCELCTQVTSPDGTEHKPKYYVYFNSVIPSSAKRQMEGRAEDIATALEMYLRAGWPLPASLVMEYNRNTE